MAKFKTGDKVRLVEDVKAGTAGAFTLHKGISGVVEDVQSVRGKEYLVEFPEGSFYVGADKVVANSCTSTNPVVQNALSGKVAANYNPFFVGDVVTYSDNPGKRFKVRKCGTDWCKINEIDGSGKYVKSGNGLDYDAYVVPVGRIHKINNSANPVVQNALNRRVALNFGEFHVGAKIKVGSRIGTIIKMHGYNDLLADVRFDDGEVKTDINILRPEFRPLNSAACNAADTDKVKVVCETETLFGTRREEKTMTVAELRAAFAKVGSSRLFNDVMRRFDEGKDANVLLHIPCETWIVKS